MFANRSRRSCAAVARTSRTIHDIVWQIPSTTLSAGADPGDPCQLAAVAAWAAWTVLAQCVRTLIARLRTRCSLRHTHGHHARNARTAGKATAETLQGRS